MTMSQDCKTKLAMISEELFSTDWAGRFDSFETFHGASRVSVDRILDQIEVLAKSNLKTAGAAKNNQSLINALEQNKPQSPEWLWASVLLKVSSIRMAMQKNLGYSAVMASIQLMYSLIAIVNEEPVKADSTDVPQKASVKKLKPKSAPSAGASQSAPSTKNPDRHLQSVVMPATKPAKGNLSTNVVLQQLVAEDEPAQDGASLSQQCHEVAEELADKYPEYTLTAIRVLTAEKLGVSRQYLENLGVTPKKFRR